MRIAQIAPLYEAVPPRLYGGTERVVAYLCDALVDAGHEHAVLQRRGAHQSRAGRRPRPGDPARPGAASPISRRT